MKHMYSKFYYSYESAIHNYKNIKKIYKIKMNDKYFQKITTYNSNYIIGI